MCGISGLFDWGGALDEGRKREIVARLNAMQGHRGPDAHGMWVAPGAKCVLGHRRLSIIDLDERSNQPMVSRNGSHVLVFNGEIYNYKALCRELEAEGIEFRTTSDSEVLLEAYLRWGNAVFARLDGMFALAIYDVRRETLILARDKLGEKPLYVARAGGMIAFASEFKPLLTMPGLSREVSEASLYEYFILRYVADPHTLYEAISSVQPGTFQVFGPDSQWEEHGYFSFEIPPDRPAMNPADYLDDLEEALTAAVRTRLVADVPLGAFLSSGVDSSLVCGIAAVSLGEEVQCFGAGFVGSPDSETIMARQIAQAYGLPFEEYLVSEDDMLRTAANFGALMDEPNGDRSCVPTYFLSRLVRTRVKVAVSGDGGDELFGGYGRYAGLRGRLDKEESPVDAICDYFFKGLPVFDPEVLERAFPGQPRHFRERVASRFVAAFARRELDDIERLRLVDLHTYLPGAVLAKVDRMSMRHGLEVRTPFFSPEVLGLSMRLPLSLCADGNLLKLALRRLLERYLPETLIRPVKQGFGMPASFFKNHAAVFDGLAGEADQMMAEWPALRERPEALALLRRASRDNVNSYWAWITLAQWATSLPG